MIGRGRVTEDMFAEKSLPESYIASLQSVDVYRRTSVRQTIALSLLAVVVVPTIFPLFLLARLFRNKKGESPKWLQWLIGRTFMNIWAVHDNFLRHLFGSGEVTDAK